MTVTTSAELLASDQIFSEVERFALADTSLATAASPGRLTHWTFGSSQPGATSEESGSSVSTKNLARLRGQYERCNTPFT